MENDIKLIEDIIMKIRECLENDIDKSELESGRTKLKKCCYKLEDIITILGFKLNGTNWQNV